MAGPRWQSSLSHFNITSKWLPDMLSGHCFEQQLLSTGRISEKMVLVLSQPGP